MVIPLAPVVAAKFPLINGKLRDLCFLDLDLLVDESPMFSS